MSDEFSSEFGQLALGWRPRRPTSYRWHFFGPPKHTKLDGQLQIKLTLIWLFSCSASCLSWSSSDIVAGLSYTTTDGRASPEAVSIEWWIGNWGALEQQASKREDSYLVRRYSLLCSVSGDAGRWVGCVQTRRPARLNLLLGVFVDATTDPRGHADYWSYNLDKPLNTQKNNSTHTLARVTQPNTPPHKKNTR